MKTSTTVSHSDKDLEYQQRMRDTYNEGIGNLTGYNCPICKNKGYTYALKGLNLVAVPCTCIEIRESIMLKQNSGLMDKLKEQTFNSFKVAEEWQKNIFNAAKKYAEEHNTTAFFIGGQSGVGKTHLCTAIVNLLLEQKIGTRYFVWETEVKEILSRSGIEDRDSREKLLRPLTETPAIYLDDFMRKKTPSQAEMSLAFDIINQRYNTKRITIISSEHTINELLAIDEAIAGRIKEMSGAYCLNISADRSKNYRLRKQS